MLIRMFQIRIRFVFRVSDLSRRSYTDPDQVFFRRSDPDPGFSLRSDPVPDPSKPQPDPQTCFSIYNVVSVSYAFLGQIHNNDEDIIIPFFVYFFGTLSCGFCRPA